MTANNTTALAKTCRTTRNIVKVLRILCYVAIAMFVFVAAASPFFMNTDIPGVEFTIDGQPAGEYDNPLGVVMTKGSFAVSALVIGSVIMLLCEKVLRSVDTESTPFVPENVKRIKTIAILVAVTSVVPSWIAQIVGLCFGSRELMMNVEVTTLVFALVIWCVALIFEYGVTLQQREDETL